MSIEKINLFANKHAIEVVNFVICLSTPIDSSDLRRFAEIMDSLKKWFPAINDLATLQIEIPSGLHTNSLPPPLPVKEMAYFASDGTRQWIGEFGVNQIMVSCRQYSTWNQIWPEAKNRLDALLACIDPYKTVRSVDYSVTDTFNAKRSDEALTALNLFKPVPLIPKHLLDYHDPRWDISQGWFEQSSEGDQVLVRFDAKSGIHNDSVLASISNLHSVRFKMPATVNELGASESQVNMESIFSDLHDKNKMLIRKILSDDLLSRMHLKDDINV